MRQRRENNPNVLGYNYDELVGLDTVNVELVPEKKGIILKHNEYHVSSKVRKRKYAVNNDYYDFLFCSVFWFETESEGVTEITTSKRPLSGTRNSGGTLDEWF